MKLRDPESLETCQSEGTGLRTYILLHILLSGHHRALANLKPHLRGRFIHEPTETSFIVPTATMLR